MTWMVFRGGPSDICMFVSHLAALFVGGVDLTLPLSLLPFGNNCADVAVPPQAYKLPQLGLLENLIATLGISMSFPRNRPRTVPFEGAREHPVGFSLIEGRVAAHVHVRRVSGTSFVSRGKRKWPVSRNATAGAETWGEYSNLCARGLLQP